MHGLGRYMNTWLLQRQLAHHAHTHKHLVVQYFYVRKFKPLQPYVCVSGAQVKLQLLLARGARTLPDPGQLLYNRLSGILTTSLFIDRFWQTFFLFCLFWWVISPYGTKIAFRDKTGLSVCIYIFIYIHGMTPTCGQIVFTSKCNFGTNRSYNSSKRTFWAIIC